MIVKFEKYISKTLEAKAFKTAFEYFLTLIEDKVHEIHDNTYIKKINLSFIRAYELFYDIPEDATLTLDERRQQILLVKITRPPFTLNTITQQIRSFTGLNNEITLDLENLVLTIDLTDVSRFLIKQVHTYMRRVKPVNVVYQIQTSIKDLNDKNQYYVACSITQFIDVSSVASWKKVMGKYATWGDVLDGNNKWGDLLT